MDTSQLPRGDRAFYDELFDALDAHLKRGADADLMMAALGTKLAEVLARCIHHGHLPRAEAEAWIARQKNLLHTPTWAFVQELEAQPRE